MEVGHIRTLMNGSRTSVPIFPKIAFEWVVVVIAHAHIWQEGRRSVRSGQVLLGDFIMEIRDHKHVAGWRIRICKTPRA